jgi:hypothetical protein
MRDTACGGFLWHFMNNPIRRIEIDFRWRARLGTRRHHGSHTPLHHGTFVVAAFTESDSLLPHNIDKAAVNRHTNAAADKRKTYIPFGYFLIKIFQKQGNKREEARVCWRLARVWCTRPSSFESTSRSLSKNIY